jgi:rhodanese-related sulfurtransferase
MKTYKQLVAEAAKSVKEVFPWDVEANNNYDMVVDVREADEFAVGHIEGAINVPRGVLEGACDPDYDETVEDLVSGREKTILLVCRSGYRSVLAAFTMQLMGFTTVHSLKLGARGWFEYDMPLVDASGNPVGEDVLDAYFSGEES